MKYKFRVWSHRKFFFFFFSFIFISWGLITLQYCSGFCHTLTWISHGFTRIPHPDPPSHLPLYPILFQLLIFLLEQWVDLFFLKKNALSLSIFLRFSNTLRVLLFIQRSQLQPPSSFEYKTSVTVPLRDVKLWDSALWRSRIFRAVPVACGLRHFTLQPE